MANISKVLQKALNRAIAREDPTTNLEFVGVPYRVINMLAKSEHEVTTIKKLLSLTQEEIILIPNFGSINLRHLLKGVRKYPELERMVLERDEQMRLEKNEFDYFQTITYLWELQGSESIGDASVSMFA